MKNLSKALFTLAALVFLSAGARAADYYDKTIINTTTNKATKHFAGDVKISNDISSSTTSFEINGGSITKVAAITASVTLTNPTVTNLTVTSTSSFAGTLTASSNVVVGDATTDTLTVTAYSVHNASITVNQGIYVSSPSVFSDTITASKGISTSTGVFSGTVTVTNNGTGAITVTGGITAGSGNVAIVDQTGKIPALSSTYLASLSGASLTSLTPANVSAGSLPSTVIASSVAVNTVGVAQVNATGSPSATTFLRGDGTWNSGNAGDAVLTSTQTWSGVNFYTGGISWDGWSASTATFTKIGTSSMTASGNWTGVWQKGDKLKYIDGGNTEYAYITSTTFSSSVTTFTFTSGSDYSMGASPSAVYFSKVDNPTGHPIWFNTAAPTWDTAYIDNGTGGVQPTTPFSKFKIDGKTVTCHLYVSGTKNTTGAIIAFNPATIYPAWTGTQYDSVIGSAYNEGGYIGITYMETTTKWYFNVHANITDNTAVEASGMFSYEF